MLTFKTAIKTAALIAVLAVFITGCAIEALAGSTAMPSDDGDMPADITLSGLKAVSAGYAYSLAVDSKGRVLAWGNYRGAIQGERYPFNTEEIQFVESDAVYVAAGADFCAVIRTDGSLLIWGTNKSVCGELGAPEPVEALDDVASVSLGGGYVLAVKTDGSLWAWGDNRYGQLGDSSLAASVIKPVQIMKGVKKAAAGSNFSLILLEDGTLLGCGLNESGQLLDYSDKKVSIYYDTSAKTGVQTTPVKLMDGIADIAAGPSHSLALDSLGNLWAFGENNEGQVGDNWDKKTTAIVPVHIDAQCRKPVKVMTDVHTILASGAGSGAVKEDGSLWLWGGNNYGQVGDGSFSNAYVPKQIKDDVAFASQSGTHTLAVKRDGSLWAWGHNRYGELGLGYCNYQYGYVQVDEGVSEVSSNGKTTLILHHDGSLYGVGSNDYGQLAGAQPGGAPAPVLLMKDVRQTALGFNAAFCVKTDGTLWAWGNNLCGALGNGKLEEGKYVLRDNMSAFANQKIPKDYRERTVAPRVLHAPQKVLDDVKQIFVYQWTVYALKNDGTVWGWGMNEYGYAFADNTSGNTAKPKKRMTGVMDILDMGMVLKEDGFLYTWGRTLMNDSPNKLTKSLFSDVVCAVGDISSRLAVKSDGTLWALGTFGNKTFDKPVQIENHVRKVDMGSDILILSDDNTLYSIMAYGFNQFMGAVGGNMEVHLLDNEYVEKVMEDVADFLTDKSSTIGGENGCSFIIKTDGTLWASGYNNYGQLGDGRAIFTPKQVLK